MSNESIVAAYTAKEGGYWIVPEDPISIAYVNYIMDYPNWPIDQVAALLFYNGAIYDLILARLHHFPWRHINLNKQLRIQREIKRVQNMTFFGNLLLENHRE